MRTEPALFLVWIALTASGCARAEDSTPGAKPAVWCDVALGCAEVTEDLAYHQVYLAWPDGRSLAFILPFKEPSSQEGQPAPGFVGPVEEPQPSAPAPAGEEKASAHRVVASIREGVFYYDDRLLCEFPEPDNRCYVLGKDLKLHDTARSAEWLRGPTRPVGKPQGLALDVRKSDDGSISYSVRQTRPDGKIVGGAARDGESGILFVVIPPNCAYAHQCRAFWHEAGSLAFEGDTELLVRSPFLGGNAQVDAGGSRPARAAKWSVHDLHERPNDWGSNYPKDDWGRLLAPNNPELNKALQ